MIKQGVSGWCSSKAGSIGRIDGLSMRSPCIAATVVSGINSYKRSRKGKMYVNRAIKHSKKTHKFLRTFNKKEGRSGACIRSKITVDRVVSKLPVPAQIAAHTTAAAAPQTPARYSKQCNLSYQHIQNKNKFETRKAERSCYIPHR